MANKNILLSIIIFSLFMIVTSLIKTETRLIEKEIILYEKKISNLKNEIYESQLDYFYLSSPEYISKKINEYSEDQYFPIEFSKIYLSLDEFINEKKKTTKVFIDEKKN